MDNNNKLYEPYQGFIRGNMFQELYDNYGKVYDIKPMNEQAELLTYLDIYTFACIDIGMYLNIYPNNQKMIELYNNYSNELKRITYEYEKLYGPINQNSQALETYPWSWINGPFPWEV